MFRLFYRTRNDLLIAEGNDLLSGLYACACICLSLWNPLNFALVQESVERTGSCFLFPTALIPLHQRLLRVNTKIIEEKTGGDRGLAR